MRPSEDWTRDTAECAERAIGYRFRDRELLKTCFTHKSYANRMGGEYNERLEFLGDAVLQLVVSEALFYRDGEDEGGMTERRKQYVSQTALTASAERAGLIGFLRYAGGEDTLRGKTPSNLFEAVVAGIYLDGGFAEAKRFLRRFLIQTQTENYKTLLQEYVQEREKKPPLYHVFERAGVFYCTVDALGRSASGEAHNKKQAETQAAKRLYFMFTAQE